MIHATWSESCRYPLVAVGNQDGEMALTRTPRSAHWAPSSRVRATTAALLAL